MPCRVSGERSQHSVACRFAASERLSTLLSGPLSPPPPVTCTCRSTSPGTTEVPDALTTLHTPESTSCLASSEFGGKMPKILPPPIKTSYSSKIRIRTRAPTHTRSTAEGAVVLMHNLKGAGGSVGLVTFEDVRLHLDAILCRCVEHAASQQGQGLLRRPWRIPLAADVGRDVVPSASLCRKGSSDPRNSRHGIGRVLG